MPRGPRKPRLKVKKVVESDDIVIERRPEVRPSTVAIARLAPSVMATRQPIPEEPPFMYTIYRLTAQRCPLHLKSLNSNGCYVIVSDREKVVFVWLGQLSSDADQELAVSLGHDVLKRDLNKYDAPIEEVQVVTEGKEKRALLLDLLQLLGHEEAEYRSKIARVERSRNLPDNSEVVVGYFERQPNGSIIIHQTGHESPDENGCVKRTNFPPIQNESTITVSRVGEHWDIWVSRGASSDFERDVKSYVTKVILDSKRDPNLDELFARAFIFIVRQGCERVLFRFQFKIFTDFEPPDRSIPWIPPKPKVVVSEAEKTATTNKSLYDILEVKAEEKEDIGSKSGYAKPVNPYLLPPPLPKSADEVRSAEELEEESVITPQTEGRRYVTRDMFVIKEAENLAPAERVELCESLLVTPKTLIGWQIEIDEGRHAGIHVVTGVKKSFFFSKSLFRLTNFHDKDVWVRLRRGRGKNGVVFRPLRHVTEITE